MNGPFSWHLIFGMLFNRMHVMKHNTHCANAYVKKLSVLSTRVFCFVLGQNNSYLGTKNAPHCVPGPTRHTPHYVPGHNTCSSFCVWAQQMLFILCHNTFSSFYVWAQQILFMCLGTTFILIIESLLILSLGTKHNPHSVFGHSKFSSFCDWHNRC